MKCSLKTCGREVTAKWHRIYCSNECARKDKRAYSEPLAKKGRTVVKLKLLNN